MYTDLYTYARKEDTGLKEWAQTKAIHQQDEGKRQEFLDYRKSSSEEIREAFRKIVEERFSESD